MPHDITKRINFDPEFYLEAEKGNVPGHRVFTLFGRNESVDNNDAAICLNGIYRMPNFSNATQLRIKAGGNAGDSFAGAGARGVTFFGLNELGDRVTETVQTEGNGASALTTNTFSRLFGARVSESGSYVTDFPNDSQLGVITIEDAAGTEDWAIIDQEISRTQLGAYSIPKGETAHFLNIYSSSDGNKPYNFSLISRTGIDILTAPFAPFVKAGSIIGLEVPFSPIFSTPIGPFPELTDLVFLAEAVGGGGGIDVSVNFTMILIRDDLN